VITAGKNIFLLTNVLQSYPSHVSPNLRVPNFYVTYPYHQDLYGLSNVSKLDHVRCRSKSYT
jgi:hypothetical protein